MTDRGSEDVVHAASFHWSEAAEALDEVEAQGDVRLSGDASGGLAGCSPEGDAVRVVPPLALDAPDEEESAASWLARQPDDLGVRLIVLVQAGAHALGVLEEDELVRHKVARKYVVRGTGRAQPTHLAAKGKSRFGSRLRLQNARSLLAETLERMHAWHDELGGVDAVHWSASPTAWGEILRTPPGVPWTEATPTRKIPLDVRAPSLDELQRVVHALTHGRVVWTR